jgi:hypothetical protein
MHHPDICDILLAIEDFLLLVDDSSYCEIIPQHCYGGEGYGNEVLFRQICLRRKLACGWLDVVIRGLGEDDNTISFEYLSRLEPRSIHRIITIERDDYSLDRVRDAIREILILDKKSTIEKTKQLAPATY